MSCVVFEKEDIIVNTEMYIEDGVGPYAMAYLIDTRKLVDIVDKIRHDKGYKTFFLEPLDEDVWYDFIVDIPCEDSVGGIEMYARVENAEDEDVGNEYTIELSNEQKQMIYEAVKAEYEKNADESWTFERFLKNIESYYDDEEI